MEALWALVNVSQLISLMPLLQLRFPSNTRLLFQILAFLNGDIYLLQFAYAQTVGQLIKYEDPQPFNDRFKMLGECAS